MAERGCINSEKKILLELSGITGKSIDSENASTIIPNELSELSNEIKKLNTGIERDLKSRETKFQGIESDIEKLEVIHKVLTTKDSIENLKDIPLETTNEVESLKGIIRNLSQYQESLKDIMGAITDVQITLASKMIEDSSQDISNLYEKLCKHPYYNELQIDVKSRNIRGLIKNSYAIKAFNAKGGRKTLVSTRFSTGQMNSVALAIYLALSKNISSKIKFLILDDPSQSLDRLHKKGLSEVLNGIISHNQVLISTHDKELQEFLQSEIPSKDRYLYYFAGWDKEGPRVSLTEIMDVQNSK